MMPELLSSGATIERTCSRSTQVAKETQGLHPERDGGVVDHEVGLPQTTGLGGAP